mgnify:CR=1 FL=1
MAKILGYKQQRVQFFYDSLVRARGSLSPTLSTRVVLFAGATPGVLADTNLKVPGQLANDETFLTYAIRHEVYLRPTGQSNSNTTSAATDFDLRSAGLFRDLVHHTTFQCQISEKIEFEGPWFMTPQGGGTWGFLADSVDVNFTNGEPQARAIYVLPLPIPIAARQSISMIEQFEDIPAGGAAGTTAVTVLSNLNTFQGVKIIRAYVDGFHSRDIL